MTKKIIRKVLVALLVAALVLGNNVSVFAQEIDLLIDSYEEPAVDEIPEEEDILEELPEEDTEDVEVLIDEPQEELPDDELITDSEIAGDFPGVDIVGFCSDPEIIEDKEILSENLDDIEKCVPGEDYIEGEIIVAAKDEETAEIYAEGFGGSLGAYLDGYCLIILDTQDENNDGYHLTVADAVLASADPDSALPAAFPNYKGDWLSDEVTEYEESYNEDFTDISDTTEWTSIYDDPYLNGTSSSFQYQHQLLQTDVAWRAGYKGSGVKVAVIDSGAHEAHEDIVLAGKGAYDYGTKKFNSVSGTLVDPVGHGTHCSGIVAARANNSVGGAGIAPDASLYAAKISDSSGGFDEWSVYSAIRYATSTWKVDVMSISLSIGSATTYAADIEAAVRDAYKAGIAVFVASGNDSCNLLQYPAKCNEAIVIGAVNAANAKTSFSNQNNHVRYSGPGYDIYSTYNGSASSYTPMSGTSMACPSIAGTAAVILSSGKITGSGSKKVDNLLAFMDNCTTKSGIGKGTPNLAKAFGYVDSNAVPQSPTTSVQPGTITAASRSITLKSAPGTTIYYDKKGGNITIKNGIISSNATCLNSNSGSVTLYASDGGKQTIKAMAVDNNTKLCSKVVSYTYTFKPKVSSIEISSSTPGFIVAKGASIQLTATIKPSCATVKTVKWSIPSPVNGVSIVEKSGKVTIGKDVSASSVTVRATATDGSNVNKEQKITIVSNEKKVKSIKAASGNVKLYSGTTVSDLLTTLDQSGKTISSQNYLKVSSANEGIAKATIDANNNLKITAVSAGKTAITCYSTDGSNKKVSVNVTVLQKVTSITLNKTSVDIVQGGNYTPTCEVAPTNASNKKVKWSLRACPSTTTLKTCGVTVNASSGQVKAAANAVKGIYTVMCEAADGQGTQGTLSVTVRSGSTKITKLTLNSSSNITLFRVTNTKDRTPQSVRISASVSGGSSSYLEVSSSEDKIVSASISSGIVTIKATGNGIGTANVTVATTDGTNIKKVIKVKVINPPSALALTLPKDRSEMLSYGKTMTIKPIFYTDNGPIEQSSKKLIWKSSNPSIISVSSSGTVKSCLKYNVSSDVTITAETTDGSGLKASIKLKSNPAIRKMKVDNAKGQTVWFSDGSLGMASLQLWVDYGVQSLAYPVEYKVSGPEGGCMVQGGGSDYSVIFTKSGNYSITFKFLDGSNKSATCRWSVRR